MELFQLEYFLEAARQRNFTRAAAHLNLAQAALSEQIRKLEAELGTALFSRGRRETVLTAAGPRIACESGGLETIRSLVAAGLGIAVLPQLATRQLSSKCKAISILGGHVERQVSILSRCDHTSSASALVFLDILKRQAERELNLHP